MKWGYGLRNGTRVPRGCFTAVKIFVEGGYGAIKSFHSGGSLSQPYLDFTAATLWLRNHFTADGQFRRGLSWAAKSLRPLNFSCSWALFGSLRPSFTFFAIPPKLDYSKNLSYIKITQLKIKIKIKTINKAFKLTKLNKKIWTLVKPSPSKPFFIRLFVVQGGWFPPYLAWMAQWMVWDDDHWI